jgi:GrpB-like predicted nucleotidyltransferase (UPF0157 family)
VSSIVVKPYDPGWPMRADELAREFADALGPRARRIEHIGSTSIPGMAAKPVYDMQISVDDLAEAAKHFDEPLAAFDLVRSPYEHDHVPAGRNEDPELWTKRLWSRDRNAPEPINLHVRRVGSGNERLALLFRDWFRAHPDAVPAYAAFKMRLAEAVDEIGLYSTLKDPVVDLVIVTAERWAADTGWTS